MYRGRGGPLGPWGTPQAPLWSLANIKCDVANITHGVAVIFFRPNLEISRFFFFEPFPNDYLFWFITLLYNLPIEHSEYSAWNELQSLLLQQYNAHKA